MIRPRSSAPAGFALVIVMLVIAALATLAAGFAYSMRLEIQLARGMTYDTEALWLARSGVELARYVLGTKARIPNQAQFDSLDQKWAGGLGDTNDVLMDIALENNELGPGRFSVYITDLERKININAAGRDMIQRALENMGCDSVWTSMVLDSLEDWRDPNQDARLNGVESDYYLGLDPPYVAKDGQIDDISELLLIRGITPELFWGSRGSPSSTPLTVSGSERNTGRVSPTFGLVDLFTAYGAPRININTAPVEVLEVLPGMDANLAEGIVRERAGSDGADGTEDDRPWHNVGELINVGVPPQQIDLLRRLCDVRSVNFEVRVVVEIPGRRRTYVAWLTRSSAQNVQVINGYWE